MRVSMAKRLLTALLVVVITLMAMELAIRCRPPSPLASFVAQDQRKLIGFSPDGSVFATIGTYGFSFVRGGAPVRLWDARTLRQRAVLAERWGGICPDGFSPDSKLFAIRPEGQPPELWDVAQGRRVTTLPAWTAWLCFSGDSKILALGDGVRVVRIWDSATLLERALLRNATRPLAFSPDGTILATASEDFSVKIWDVSTGREIATLPGHTAKIVSLVFSPDGKSLLSAQGSSQWWPYVNHTPKPAPGKFIVWDVQRRKHWASIEWTHVGEPGFAANNKMVIVGGGAGDSASLWNIETEGTPTLVNSWLGQRRAFSPDGKRMAVLDLDTSNWSLTLLEIEGWREVSSFRADRAYKPGDFEPRVEFSPDSKNLFAHDSYWTEPSDRPKWLNDWLHRSAQAQYVQVLRVFDAATGELTGTLRAPGRQITWSPDGKLAAIMSSDEMGAGDGTITIWDLPPFQPSSLVIVAATLLSLGVLLAAYWAVRRLVRFILARGPVA